MWALAAVLARAEPLTWDDCVREAMAGNPDLVAAWETTRAADASVRSTASERKPQLSASAGFDRSGGDRSDVAGEDENDYYSAGLRASQVVYTGGRLSADIAARQAALDEARAAFLQTAANVSFDLRAAFARLLFAQDLEILTRDIERRRKDNLDLVELRFEGGSEHKGSYLRSKASASQATFERGQSGRTLGVARRELARVLGRTTAEDLAARGDYPAGSPEPEPDYAALALVTPLRDQVEARRRIAEANVRSARSGYFPDVSLDGGVTRSGEEFAPDSENWVVGIGLSYPFYPGGRTRHDVAGAQASLRRSEAQVRSSEADILRDLESAYAAFLDALGDLDVQRQFLEASQVRAEIGRRQYASGLLSFEDWDVIEDDLINAQKAVLASQRDAALAAAAWDLAKGKELFGEQP
jgi:outer membrane protein TolC